MENDELARDEDRPEPNRRPLRRLSPNEEWLLRFAYRYVTALDRGDPEEIGQALEAAVQNPELDEVIAEIDAAYQDELGLGALAADAELVRNLLREYLPSAPAEEEEEVEARPLTVGEVALRLQGNRQISADDQPAMRQLRDSSMPLPAWLSAEAIRQLASSLGVKASSRFWRAFRDAAITLGMGRAQDQLRLAAAREARAREMSSRQAGRTRRKPRPAPREEER